MEEKRKLFGLTLNELKTVVKELGLPGFNAGIIADWLYKKNVLSIDEMSNLSKKARNVLNHTFEMGLTRFSNVQESVDGTKKYLFPTGNQKFVETAYIPESDRATLCVSSQVGCKMGCLFCMTGKQGFQANLSAGEIINQLRSLPERNKITNLVYMGMGEPFDNIQEVMKSLEILTSDWGFAMSPKRITVSTIGIIPGMKEFLAHSSCHLAVSLHSPFDEERKKLMPIENVYNIKEVIKEIRSFDFGKQRRVSFEYIVFSELNDTAAHAKELARLLNGMRCRMNLIRFHPIPDTPLKGTSDIRLQEFKDQLMKKGITTTIRASRGEDIYAACGLLSTKSFVKQKESDF